MPNVVYINLDRGIERRAFMERQLETLGVNYQRFPGVLGEDVPEEVRSYFFNVDGDGSPTSLLKPGEVGCYASHLAVAKAVVNGELPDPVLVLEDDTLLPDDLATLIDEVVAIAPSDWDYIRLSGFVKRPVKAIHQLNAGRSLVRYWKLPADTAAYILNRKGACKILSVKPTTSPIDIELGKRWKTGLRVYGVFPIAVVHDQLPSVLSSIGRQRDKQSFAVSLERAAYAGRFIFEIRELGPIGFIRAVSMHWMNHLRKALGKKRKFLIR
jgi:glycosyl transferase family 25